MMHTCCAFNVIQSHYYPNATSKPWKRHVIFRPLLSANFVLIPHRQIKNGYGDCACSDPPSLLVPMASSSSLSNDDTSIFSSIFSSTSSSSQVLNGEAAKGSGTTARGRRLLKILEEKRRREYDRVRNYPSWAKSSFWLFCLHRLVLRVLEEACKTDSELRAILCDIIGNPDLMRKSV